MIVIPAYNEAENLKYLLPQMPVKIKDTELGVLVVDDGSEDETIQIVKDHNQFVVSNPINRGGGAALRLGYDILKNSDAAICVTMDADGQHQPEDIEELVAPIIDDEYDIVIGSRVMGSREKDDVIRIAGVHIFSTIISSLLGKRITDPSSGFRAFKMDKMRSINLYEDQYHTSELIIEAVKKGLRVKEVPITILKTILKRKFGKSKKGRDLTYGFHFAKTIIKTWWR
jgi:glycosyltransferase involved in cell wall biosynthesis